VSFADTKIQARYKVDNGNIAKIMAMEAKGGGGTSMESAFDEIRDMHTDVPVLCCLTDGCDSYGRTKRDYPFEVIWCITPDGQDHQPYGIKLKMS
jgi:predicted metal-dependent peptidase